MKNQTFEQWLEKVAYNVQLLCGMSLDDLPDCPYRDWYDDNMAATTAARRVIRNTNE